MKSSSSLGSLRFTEKVRQALALGLMHLRRNHADIFENFGQLITEYDELLNLYGRKSLHQSKVLEVGFGARPFRLVWLHCSEIDVHGVDLDRPLLRLSAKSLLQIAQTNGVERAVKSLLRYVLTDRNQWKQMAAKLELSGRAFVIPSERLIIADAKDADFWNGLGRMDVVFSEDVFEHVPKDDLTTIVRKMADALRPNGIAIIRPMIFTGICGGHHLEWYPHLLNDRRIRRTEPWEHLRKNRYPASTYLNCLSKKDYVEIFQEHFKILEDRVMLPGLGSEYLTPDVRAELSKYSEEELFSNSVRFVLEPR
jgi:SAM-dependent methyltransferase